LVAKQGFSLRQSMRVTPLDLFFFASPPPGLTWSGPLMRLFFVLGSFDGKLLFGSSGLTCCGRFARRHFPLDFLHLSSFLSNLRLSCRPPQGDPFFFPVLQILFLSAPPFVGFTIFPAGWHGPPPREPDLPLNSFVRVFCPPSRPS